MADAETAAMLLDGMEALGLNSAVVRINNRRILDALVELGGIDDEEIKKSVFGAIDDFDKDGIEKVLGKIAAVINDNFVGFAQEFLTIDGSNQEKLRRLEALVGKSEAGQEGLANLQVIFQILEAGGYGDRVRMSPEIVRGLGYYTGPIFETFIPGFERVGSVASGGRYDNLVQDLGGPSLPAVGASFGVSRIQSILEEMGMGETASTKAEILILNLMPELAPTYFAMAAELRRAGVPVRVYEDPRKFAPQIKLADSQGIPFALIVGEQEMANGTVQIKDLSNKEQIEIPANQLISYVQSLVNGRI
jgi:histidyl-tRNA synthetase